MANKPQQQQRPHQQQHHRHSKLNPDPIRTSPHSKLSGCGPHRSYRHLHHQRGTVGTFHVRLLEGRGLCRKHWSALSLGPVKHLGLSRAHGEVSSFGTLRLAFSRDGSGEDGDFVEEDEVGIDGDVKKAAVVADGESKRQSTSYASLSSTTSSMTSSSTPSQTTNNAQHAAFMPSMPMAPMQQPTTDSGKSPLTPLVFDQGCIRAFSPSRSPFFPSQSQPSNNQQQEQAIPSYSSGFNNNDWDTKQPFSMMPTPPKPTSQKGLLKMMPTPNPAQTRAAAHFGGPPPPHHYAKEQFKSSTVHNDSNPIWGDAHSFLDSTSHHNHNNNHNNENRSSFHIPLQKDDLLPALHTDGGKVTLEVRLDEEMAPTESLLVGGALSTAVGAATAATSVVGMGRQAQTVSNMGMEMLGLGTDRLIGRGCVDLMPLLLGLWEESWEQKQQLQEEEESDWRRGNVAGKEKSQDGADDDATLNEYGRINPTAHGRRRRVERMGMMDVWVPLYHPTAMTTKASSSNNNGNDDNKMETSGKIHLLISYEPNGMIPKRDDIVAFESFARRPLTYNNHHPDGGATSSSNIGPVITPTVPPLSPLSVIETRGPYLLLQYITSRTVTSVDRAGNVKSSRWERSHRVRIHRPAVFVIERRTLMDAAGNIARMPGDIVLSTAVGQEIAEVSAPIVAGAMELMGPAMLWGRLAMA
eukprot:CAMPEP_0201912938 /NCGR_PEP_ID=MMETSP0903-20130614/3476_1 /ASSEMBLY_ACC=CAM_ASM_000552 /TAXON_ID=420261 /ORGANISM="Thalassiosira antarctica, Strain CCMP982" /LENGTH=693 /DNA_ID=CAMNT_0048448001 /DNA_START=123 /DNA_END=2201 /DNA_ORIENTATION=+